MYEGVPAMTVPRAQFNTTLINQMLSVVTCTLEFWLKFAGNHSNLK